MSHYPPLKVRPISFHHLRIPLVAMSEQIEELVKAAVQKELKKIQAVDTSTGKTKKKTSPELDTTRTMGEHVQDPRSSTDCWPCVGKHIPKAGGNKWGQWLECDRCALRLKYTPTKGSPAEFTHIALPANVTRALNHLRSEGFTMRIATIVWSNRPSSSSPVRKRSIQRSPVWTRQSLPRAKAIPRMQWKCQRSRFTPTRRIQCSRWSVQRRRSPKLRNQLHPRHEAIWASANSSPIWSWHWRSSAWSFWTYSRRSTEPTAPEFSR